MQGGVEPPNNNAGCGLLIGLALIVYVLYVLFTA